MTKFKELADKIKGEKKIALFLHINPDGDTIGSTLAIQLALSKLGIESDVYCENEVPIRFNYLKGVESIKTTLVGDYTAYMAVDVSCVSRVGIFQNDFERFKNTYSLDHHISNDFFAKYNLVNDCPANAENAYKFIKELGVKIDKDIANCLATGLLTDTGNLKHVGVTGETIRILADLVDLGADLNLINFKMFNEQSVERARLFGLTMSNIKYLEDGKVGIITISKQNMLLCGAKDGDTEGFIDFVMGIRGVLVGACLLEKEENKFKISLRGKGVNVNEIASVFGGGGHILASGCQINGNYYEVLDKLSYAIKSHIPE